MAPKDYVTRSQTRNPSTRKKSTTRGQAKARGQTQKRNQAAPVPWLRIMLALFIIALFVFALYKLQQSDSAYEPSESNVSDKRKSTLDNERVVDTGQTKVLEIAQGDTIDVLKTEVKPLLPLPVLGEEEWAFIDSLPEFSVEVDATGPVESDREYILQCGSFKTSERAQALKATLALQGYESRIVISNAGKWHRVVLGPYQSKREAEKDRHVMRRADIRRCKIY